jgi:hypothetical protein
MQSTIADRARSLTRFEPSPRHRPPRLLTVAGVTILAVALCLLADDWLALIGTHVFPSTRGYVHFQFADYAKLTVIGVLGACAGWPVITRLTSDPRWVYLRLAVAVTAVCLLPDLYIWLLGQPGQAVLVLVAMHLAIGLITYNLVVRLAPPRPLPAAPAGAPQAPSRLPSRQ